MQLQMMMTMKTNNKTFGNVTISKYRGITTHNSFGYYKKGKTKYRFSIEEIETDDQSSIAIIWDDDNIPEDQVEIESEIMKSMFSLEEE